MLCGVLSGIISDEHLNFVCFIIILVVYHKKWVAILQVSCRVTWIGMYIFRKFLIVIGYFVRASESKSGIDLLQLEKKILEESLQKYFYFISISNSFF
jgi:hypothetical protein